MSLHNRTVLIDKYVITPCIKAPDQTSVPQYIYFNPIYSNSSSPRSIRALQINNTDKTRIIKRRDDAGWRSFLNVAIYRHKTVSHARRPSNRKHSPQNLEDNLTLSIFLHIYSGKKCSGEKTSTEKLPTNLRQNTLHSDILQ